MFDPQATVVKVKGCPGMQFSPLSYTNDAATNVYWDVQNPQQLGGFSQNAAKSPYAQKDTYGREHIYEIHFSTSIGS